jgi:hypothetical protein
MFTKKTKLKYLDFIIFYHNFFITNLTKALLKAMQVTEHIIAIRSNYYTSHKLSNRLAIMHYITT